MIINQGGTFVGTTTVTFISDNYADAISTINAAAPLHIKAEDFGGYIVINSLHGGDTNFIKITGGTATNILGFFVDPHPQSVSYAGQILNSKPTFFDSSVPQQAGLIRNEALNKETLNRAFAGLSQIASLSNSNLSKEIAVPKQVNVVLAGTNSISLATTDRFYIGDSTAANISADELENVVTLTDATNNQVFDANNNKVRITSITYGTLVDATTSFSTWGTVDGKSIFGNSTHWQKVKSTGTITTITGTTVQCAGASFITDKVQVGDTAKIGGATNLIPFNHNGEFLVDEVISEEILKLKAKGNFDDVLTSSNTPSALNMQKDIGTTYGTLQVLLGKFIPVQMKGGNMTFNLSATLTGTYKLTFSAGRSVKSLAKNDLTKAIISKEYGKQIDVGSKLTTTLLNAQIPRIIADPNTDTDYTNLIEAKYSTNPAGRIHTSNLGNLQLSYNAKWDGTTWIKDDNTKEKNRILLTETTSFLGLDSVNLFMDLSTKTSTLGTSTFKLVVDSDSTLATLGNTTMFLKLDDVNNSSELTHDSLKLKLNQGTGVIENTITSEYKISDLANTILSIPDFDGTSSSQITISPGMKLGNLYTSNTLALIPKIEYIGTTSTGKYTLLSETSNLTGGKRREYVIADGTEVITINAEWDGTQWLKDTTAGSSKVVLDKENLIHYINSGTTTFSDSSWNTKEEIRNYQLNDTFYAKFSNASDTVDKVISPWFSVMSTTNTKTYPNPSPPSGVFGEAVLQSDAVVGNYQVTLKANPVFVDTGDFQMSIKIRVIDSSTLNAVDTGLTEGLIVGNITAAAEHLSFKTGPMDTWRIQIGTNLINTFINSTGGAFVLTYKRLNQFLQTYINSTLVDSRTHTTSLTITPAIQIKGTSTIANNNIVAVDFFKLWVAGLDK